MCGIFGIITSNVNKYSEECIKLIVDRLFVLSESRGKESAGIAIKTKDAVQIYKKPESASRMVTDDEYVQFFHDTLQNEFSNETDASENRYIASIGHWRLVINGGQYSNSNNQPVTTGCAVGVHDGIIVNDSALWEQCPEIKRYTDVDTEVFLALLQHNYNLTKSLV